MSCIRPHLESLSPLALVHGLVNYWILLNFWLNVDWKERFCVSVKGWSTKWKPKCSCLKKKYWNIWIFFFYVTIFYFFLISQNILNYLKLSSERSKNIIIFLNVKKKNCKFYISEHFSKNYLNILEYLKKKNYVIICEYF